jgi:hypothetical protein
MASAKDFIVNLIGNSESVDKVFDGVEKHALKISAGVAAAWAGAKIGEAFSKGMDVESAQVKMTAQLGLMPEEAERIGAASGALFADNMGDSLAEVNGAVTAVIGSFDGMREASQADLETMTGKALTFASVFDVEVSRAAQVAGQMITQGIAVDGAEAFDLLTASMQKMPPALREDLLDATDEYGQFFATLGFSGEKAMGLIVSSSAKGMFGIDKTGDALKEFIIRSTDMSTTSVAAYDALGLSAGDMSNRILAGGESASGAFDEIVSGLLAIEDPATRANTAIALFGTPIEDLGVTDIPQFLTSLQATSGELGTVKGATDEMSDAMGSTMESMVKAKKNGLDMWVAGLAEAPAPLADTVSSLIAFGPAALEVLGAVGPMVAMTGARIAQSAATAAGTAANVPFAASMWAATWPILAIIAALALIALGVWLLIDNWDAVAKWTGEALHNIWVAVTGFFGMIGDAFSNFQPLGLIISNWGPISEWIGGFFGGIGGLIGDSANWIGAKVGEIVGFFTSIPDRVGQAWANMGDLVKTTMWNVTSFAVDAWNNTLGQINMTLPGWLGGAHIQFPHLTMPALAAGGVVTGPTVALIGEAGAEAVVPLDRAGEFGFGDGGGSRFVDVPVEVYLDGKVLYRAFKRIELREG